MRHERTPTDVLVNVIDLSGLMPSAVEKLKQLFPDSTVLGADPGRWGYVMVNHDMYALCDEGVGPVFPIRHEDPLSVDVWGEYQGKTPKEGRRIDFIAPIAITMDDDDIRALPVLEQVNLAQFIRTFGHRLDSNYEQWRRLLEQATP